MTRRLTLILILAMMTMAIALATVSGVRSFRRAQRDCQSLGRQNAMLGAQITQYVIEKGIDNGLFDPNVLFEPRYTPLMPAALFATTPTMISTSTAMSGLSWRLFLVRMRFTMRMWSPRMVMFQPTPTRA